MIATDLSADTRRLADVFIALPRGELVTLDQLSTALDRDVRQCRWIVYAAIRVVERETGAVFASERGKGYRRLASDEIVKIGQTARARICRQARRGARSMAAGVQGANDIEPEMARRILSEQSALGLLEHLARDKNLPVVPEKETRPLPVATVARDFLRTIGAKVE